MNILNFNYEKLVEYIKERDIDNYSYPTVSGQDVMVKFGLYSVKDLNEIIRITAQIMGIPITVTYSYSPDYAALLEC